MTNSKFAQVKNGTVINVIVAEQDFIDSLPKEENVEWVKTDINTLNGKSLNGGTPFRGTFAKIGGIYDKEKDLFCDAKPGVDWTLDANIMWQPPIPYPIDETEINELEFDFVWSEDLYIKSNKTKGWVSPDI